MTPSRLANFATIGFLLGVVILVFVQIETSMKEQGIASGGPYDNAASYPRTVAIIIGLLLILQLGVEFVRMRARSASEDQMIEGRDIRRALSMLVVFGIYLFALTTFGYHLATPPMIFAIMWICGVRSLVKLVVAAIAISLVFAFVFEKFLNVVLPLGIWNIFIPW